MEYSGPPRAGGDRSSRFQDGLLANDHSREQEELLSELNAIGRASFQLSDVPTMVSLLAGIGDGDSSGAASASEQISAAVVGEGADALDLESLSPLPCWQS